MEISKRDVYCIMYQLVSQQTQKRVVHKSQVNNAN